MNVMLPKNVDIAGVGRVDQIIHGEIFVGRNPSDVPSANKDPLIHIRENK